MQEPTLTDSYKIAMIEHYHIGGFAGNFLATMRLSVGDYAVVSGAPYLETVESISFWVMFLICVFVTTIIFLNFIVAEASNSYNGVSEKMEEYVQFAIADMIAEAEALLPTSLMLKRKHWFPKYIISRKLNFWYWAIVFITNFNYNTSIIR